MALMKLFWSFVQIGLFSIGGGYAAVPQIQAQVVDIHGWLSMEEFTDVIVIAEMTPGPVSINSATFVGTRIAGLPGAIVATLGCILPSLVIVLILALLYFRFRNLFAVQGILNGLKPAVVAMIAGAGVNILLLALFQSQTELNLSDIDYVAVCLFIPSLFVLLRFKRINPVFVMLADGVIGGALYLLV